MLSLPRLLLLTSCLATSVAIAGMPSMPLAQQSPAAFQQNTAAIVKTGAYPEWGAWLGKQLAAEINRATFNPSPETLNKLAAQPTLSLGLAQWKLLTATGPENLKAVAAKDGTTFLTWLLTNREALHAYLANGPLDKEGTARGLEIWRDIFNADPASRDGLWLRVAASVALAHTVPVRSLADGGEIDPLRRYQYFKTAHSSGLLFDSFNQAGVWELRFVVNSWARDEELGWVTAAADPKIKSQEKIGEACWMVPYRGENAKGVSVQNGPEYYDHKPVTLELMHTVGGVCGAISKFGTAAAQAHGIPAMPVGQPGHCAFLWKKDPQTWRTGNDISGWAGSTEHGGIFIHWGDRGSYVLLMEQAHRDSVRFLASEQARWLASATTEADKSTALLQTAAKIQPLNGGAWLDLIADLGKTKAPAAAWQQLAAGLMRDLSDYPIPLTEFLTKIEDHLALTDADARRRYVGSVSSAIASGSAEAQQKCGPTAQTELIARQARALAPGSPAQVESLLRGSDEEGEDDNRHSRKAQSPALTDAQRNAIQSLVEAALNASTRRADLEDALTGRYLGLMSSNPAALARAIKFFGGLFDQAKTNPDRKPAISLARRLILLAAKAEDLAAMEKYSAECQRLTAAE